jgi:hypothetical protein
MPTAVLQALLHMTTEYLHAVPLRQAESFESISNLPARQKCRVQHQACSVFAAVQRIVSHGGRTEAFGRHEALP